MSGALERHQGEPEPESWNATLNRRVRPQGQAEARRIVRDPTHPENRAFHDPSDPRNEAVKAKVSRLYLGQDETPPTAA